MTEAKKKVLVVEDSPVAQELLTYILNSDPELQVTAIARDGAEALKAVSRTGFDVITMDIHLPGMDGYETTRAIMESYPTPIVIVSGTLLQDEIKHSFRALEAGALAALRRPAGPGHSNYEAEARDLVRTVKLMSEVKVVRRWPQYRNKISSGLPPLAVAPVPTPQADGTPGGINVVAIGASTGGPPALQKILRQLRKDFPASILVVQHMAVGFMDGLREWLNNTCALPVKVASQHEQLRPGNVYLAPDDAQMKVAATGRLLLEKGRRENGYCPSVTYLFSSVANLYASNAVGVLLTGMGDDGAAGLQLMREKGAVTIAQDEESSVVFGMPKEAIRIGAAKHVLNLEQIPDFLHRLVIKG